MGKSGNPAKRAAQATARELELEHEDDTDEDGVVDFDAFWKKRDKKRPAKRLRIFGQVVELPKSLPLQFELEARRVAKSKRDEDVHNLVAILFGADAYEAWAEAGMDLDQFQVLLAWGPRYIAGQQVTLEQVADELAAREDDDEDEDGSGEG